VTIEFLHPTLFAIAELAHLSLAQGTIATPVARGPRAIGAEAAVAAAVTVVARVPTGRTPWLGNRRVSAGALGGKHGLWIRCRWLLWSESGRR